MNKIREELNDKGYNYGLRINYRAETIIKDNYLPFDQKAADRLNKGLPPMEDSKYIKF